MSRELKFASADEALQHLANITGRKVKVAADMLEMLKEKLQEDGYTIRNYHSDNDGYFVDGEEQTVSVQKSGSGVWMSNEAEDEVTFDSGKLQQATAWVRENLG